VTSPDKDAALCPTNAVCLSRISTLSLVLYTARVLSDCRMRILALGYNQDFTASLTLHASTSAHSPGFPSPSSLRLLLGPCF
jgi:hypothetical protein